MGILPQFLEKKDNSVILEIGAGHGGFAHALGNILRGKCTYIIIDLPEMLLFSGGFLTVNNPGKRIYIYERSTFSPEFLRNDIHDYDFVLVPNYVLPELYALGGIDLMLNLLSFPEMTRQQVDEYVRLGQSKISGYLYSDNMDRHPCNDKLAGDTITTILENRFRLFPPPQFFKAPAEGHNWITRPYVGISRSRETGLPEGGRMRYISDAERLVFFTDPQPAQI